eukprot:TRINITY_DN4808_c0_g1_i1.p1 TRINITY_DN4808_c0_g1~~TRINITY_DN4808_c0_g1_i1.p1  ORF type:complete len:706 (-),score=132.07 TRINITY_DN4808_c0_g1_i1:675-2792(-)
MDSSRRAVEAYWRSRMIDNATIDDDKVTPLYKMDEICETLRSSPFGIVKEMSEYMFKRLDHKSPRVKQKVLRLIKYSVVKSGVEFRREMQRHSGVIRQLFHYRGEADPLRGDSLNKAVRDMAHEAVSAIFASDEKQTASEDLSKRIQGFGNTNFEMLSDEKKSFLSEVVEIGSASIKQGLSIISGQSSANYLDGRSSSSGAYRGPNLRKSLTLERDPIPRKQNEESWTPPRYLPSEPRNVQANSDYRVLNLEANTERLEVNATKGNSREERLVDSITAAGGVRLQPTREAIQNFLTVASKMDQAILSEALNGKMQSHTWQVRFKALCILESLVRQKEDADFEAICMYFHENQDSIISCRESPQASLKEKANRVLSLLQSGQVDSQKNIANEKESVKPVPVEMPNLIDTGEEDILVNGATPKENLMTNNNVDPFDLLGERPSPTGELDNQNTKDDPFAGLSIHSEHPQESDATNDLFTGLVVGNTSGKENHETQLSNMDKDLLGDFSHGLEQSERKPTIQSESLDDIFSSLSVSQLPCIAGEQSGQASNSMTNNLSAGIQTPNPPNPACQPLNTMVNSSTLSTNTPFLSSVNNMAPNVMMHQFLPFQAMNLGSIGSTITQQQLLALMTNFPHMTMGVGTGNTGSFQVDSGSGNGSAHTYSDGFDFSSDPKSSHISTTESSKKGEKTTAFDFIADHISAAKSTKKVN